jgi:hypothetical protein
MEGKIDLSDEKVYKIKYNLNILTSMSEENGQLIGAIAGSDELSIFETDLIKDMVDYKWQEFAQSKHRFAACVHISYITTMMCYIVQIFLQDAKYDENKVRLNPPPNKNILVAMMIFLVYPVCYDGTQMIKQGV